MAAQIGRNIGMWALLLGAFVVFTQADGGEMNSSGLLHGRLGNVTDAANLNLTGPEATEAVTIQGSVTAVHSDTSPASTTTPSGEESPSTGSAIRPDIVPLANKPNPTPIEDLVMRQPLLGLYQMTTFFLEQMVQPRNLTELSDVFDFSKSKDIPNNLSENWQRVTSYLIGYAICAAVGIVLLVFIPLIGVLVGCFRCCGNCGGKTLPRDPKNANCGRGCCGFLLFFFVSFALAGGIIMIVTCMDLQTKLSSDQSVFDDVANSVNGLSDYTGDTVDEIQTATLGRYHYVSQKVFNKLDSIVITLDKETNASGYLDGLGSFSSSLPVLDTSVHTVNSSADNYEISRLNLDKYITQVKANVSALLESCPSAACMEANISVQALTTDAQFTDIHVEYLMIALSEAIAGGLPANIDKGIASYSNAINTANQTIQAEVNEARTASADVEDEINDYIKRARDNLNSTVLKENADAVLDVKKEGIESHYIYIPLAVFLALAILLLLVVLALYTGLLYGTTCKRASPGKSSSCTWKSGACCLITGLFLLFLFFSLLMLVLVALFLGGGLAHTEVCRHIRYLPDSPIKAMVNEAVNSFLTDFKIEVSQSYEDCARNKSIYTAFNLEANGWNISGVVDVSQIVKEIDRIKKVNINLPTVNMITPAVERVLTEMDTKFKKVTPDISTWIGETHKKVTTRDLNEVADQLAGVLTDSSDPVQMQGYIDHLRNLTEVVAEMERTKMSLGTALGTTNDILQGLNLAAVISGLKAAQDTINTRGNEIISETAIKTADEVSNTLIETVDDIEVDVRDNIGRCYPVYAAVSNIVDAGCVQLLYSLNAYWFALGMSLIFLLPAIICAFKLVGLYRRTLPFEEAHDNSLYMSAYDNPDYRSYANKNTDDEVLLNQGNRGLRGSVTVADNPVYLEDEPPYAIPIPRSVIRFGQQMVPVSPDDTYFYAMPARRSYPGESPPTYSESQPTSQV